MERGRPFYQWGSFRRPRPGGRSPSAPDDRDHRTENFHVDDRSSGCKRQTAGTPDLTATFPTPSANRRRSTTEMSGAIRPDRSNPKKDSPGPRIAPLQFWPRMPVFTATTAAYSCPMSTKSRAAWVMLLLACGGGCAGGASSGSTSTASPVSVTGLFDTTVLPCAAGYEHANICCQGAPYKATVCTEDLTHPFGVCGKGQFAYPDPDACCVLDGTTACLQPSAVAQTADAGQQASCQNPCSPGAYPPRPLLARSHPMALFATSGSACQPNRARLCVRGCAPALPHPIAPPHAPPVGPSPRMGRSTSAARPTPAGRRSVSLRRGGLAGSTAAAAVHTATAARVRNSSTTATATSCSAVPLRRPPAAVCSTG